MLRLYQTLNDDLVFCKFIEAANVLFIEINQKVERIIVLKYLEN